MINYHLISDIASGDSSFMNQALINYKVKSEELLSSTESLMASSKWSLLHLKLKSFRNKISPFLNKPALNKINMVLEVLVSSLNNSAKEKAYLELAARIKRELRYLSQKDVYVDS